MKNTLNGFNFEVPPTELQINALAQYHHQQRLDAVFHQGVHLGNLGIEQRKILHDYTRNLQPTQRLALEHVYDDQMRGLNDPTLHADSYDNPMSMFAVTVCIIALAVVLYLFAQTVIH